MKIHKVIYEIMAFVELPGHVGLAELVLDGKMGFVSMPIIFKKPKLLPAQKTDIYLPFLLVDGIMPIVERTARPSGRIFM